VGSFYVNFSVRTDTPEQVAAVLLNGDRRALVTSPNPHCPYCAVFDKEADSFREAPIEWLGTRVSATCGPVLAVSNCDSDSLDYWLFDLGRLVGRYSSTSNRFNPHYRTAAPRGDAGVLCRTLGRLEDVERVGATLRGYYLYADHQHAALAAGLGLHMYTVGGNYADVLRQCGIQFIFPEERLLWVGPSG
jgi:hypothetical protein